jgi:hypothetical protein
VCLCERGHGCHCSFVMLCCGVGDDVYNVINGSSQSTRPLFIMNRESES